MACQGGAGPGSGAREDRSKVIELREQILQLAGHDCHEEEEKSRTKLMEDLNVCKRDTLIELCHSFDISGSRANRKEELVSFLMKFLKNNCSLIDATVPVKVTDLREQILQLAGHPCHEEEETSRTGLLERLNVCKRDTLIELCRSLHIIGSRANRKEELVSFLIKFMKEQSSATDATNLDKKFKKRRRVTEEEKLSSGKSLKKKKQGTALETQDEVEANVSRVVEDRRNYLERDEKDNRYPCADIKNGNFPNEKATPKNDHKVKSCGKKGSKGDASSRKQVMKPSRDDLREAIVLILDSTDFATMTFGDVVKEVDKYFGKDLCERKPLIRSLIEEELFRLSEEAEKKELEEEEAAEAKARAEQSTNDMEQFQTVETSIDKRYQHIAGQNFETKDCGNSNEKDDKDGSVVKGNCSDAAEGLQNGEIDAGTKTGDNEPTNDGRCEKVSPSVNNDVDIQGSRNGEAAIVNMKINNVDSLECSIDGRIKEACSGEHDDIEYNKIEGDRSKNGGNNAGDYNGREAEESQSCADDERVKHAGNGQAKEASNENSNNIAIHNDNDGARL